MVGTDVTGTGWGSGLFGVEGGADFSQVMVWMWRGLKKGFEGETELEQAC